MLAVLVGSVDAYSATVLCVLLASIAVTISVFLVRRPNVVEVEEERSRAAQRMYDSETTRQVKLLERQVITSHREEG